MVVFGCLTDTSTDTPALRRRTIASRLRAAGQAARSVVLHGLQSQVAPRSARISAGRAVSPSKLAHAVKALEDLNENNDGAAVNKLEAFINEVQAQSGDKIPVAEADALIATAQLIIDQIKG